MENFRIKVFRVVARHLNFSRAAEELLLTQPAVTQQIKALEDECGVSLFERSGGRVTLSAAGAALLPYAEKLKSMADEAHRAVTEYRSDSTGVLALGASQTIAQYILPNLVAAFRTDSPRISVTAMSGNTDKILDTLAARKIDLALIEGPGLRKDFHTEPFMEDEMVLVVPANHEWANRMIDTDDLKGSPLLMREFGSGSRRIIEIALASAGVSRNDISIPMELDSTEGLLSAVEAGLGITFVSRWAVRNQLTLGTLRLAHIRGMRLARMFSIAYPAGPKPSGNAGAFRSFILTHSLHLAPHATDKVRNARQRAKEAK